MTTSQRCTFTARKTNSVLCCTRKNIATRSREAISHLYYALVRLHVEFCVPFWAPWYQKDTDVLEGVKHRATKMTMGLEHLSYKERLKELQLFRLEKR